MQVFTYVTLVLETQQSTWRELYMHAVAIVLCSFVYILFEGRAHKRRLSQRDRAVSDNHISRSDRSNLQGQWARDYVAPAGSYIYEYIWTYFEVSARMQLNNLMKIQLRLKPPYGSSEYVSIRGNFTYRLDYPLEWPQKQFNFTRGPWNNY